jgi:hypothetical protein
MTLDKLSQITEVGIQSGITLRNINVEGANVSGVVTATTLSVTEGFNVTGVVTATSFDGNVTGSINPSTLLVTGVSTFQASSFWGDGDIAYFGDGQDLLIFHNSTDSIIRDNGTGDLYIEGGNVIRMTNPTGIETYATFNQDAAVELYYDNSKKLETTGAGVTAYGIIQTQGLQSSGIVTATNGVQVGSASSITVGQSFIRNNAIGLGATDTSGRNAGVGTAVGTIVYNSTTGLLEYYNGTNWTQLKNNFDATGGTKTTSGGKTIHTFTGSGTFTVNFGSAAVDYLVVAGGGGGGHNAGAGGGAGGFRAGTELPVVAGSYSVTVGAGGNGGPSSGPQNGTNGNSSIFSTITTITSAGGGYGCSNNGAGNPGGSGGGSAANNSVGTGNTPPVSPPQGNPGGVGNTGDGADRAGGGGGGAAASGGGTTNANLGGTGGDGQSSTISGSSVTYAGGGGGSSHTGGPTAIAPGGPGGGGAGGAGTWPVASPGTSGTTNRGGGGGAGSGGGGIGGSGGSGIVIIAYPS